VSETGHHDEHAWPDAEIVQLEVHPELGYKIGEAGPQLDRGHRPGGMDAEEEPTRAAIAELLAVQDRALMRYEHAGDRVDDADSIRARDRQNVLVH
jgi:hypothetical protein